MARFRCGLYNVRWVNIYMLLVVGIVACLMSEMENPNSPLVIGLNLEPMADNNLRCTFMVSDGSLLPFVTRPVSVTLITVIALTMGVHLLRAKAVGRGGG